VEKDNADSADFRGLARHSRRVGSRRAPPGALMIDHRPEEHRIEIQAAFFRTVIDHQCGGTPRTDATSESA
jgi:hypothetical protein